jgi:hypothetical protein
MARVRARVTQYEVLAAQAGPGKAPAVKLPAGDSAVELEIGQN